MKATNPLLADAYNAPNPLTKEQWALVRGNEKAIAKTRQRNIALRAGAFSSIVGDINKKYRHVCPHCDARRSTKAAMRTHIAMEHEE